MHHERAPHYICCSSHVFVPEQWRQSLAPLHANSVCPFLHAGKTCISDVVISTRSHARESHEFYHWSILEIKRCW